SGWRSLPSSQLRLSKRKYAPMISRMPRMITGSGKRRPAGGGTADSSSVDTAGAASRIVISPNSSKVSGAVSCCRRPVAAFLRERGCELIEHDHRQRPSREEVYALLQDADGFVPALDRVDAEVFDHAPKLRVVCAQGVGYDHIDVEEATRRGIAVCTCAGCN